MQIAAEPFRVAIEDSVLEDLNNRLAATRWPNEPEGGGWFYGTDLTYLKKFVDRWQNGYDWRHWEAELNRFPQYRADVGGLKLHFIVEQGSGENPLPLILTHGWPGSVFEFHKIIEPLAHPERFGGDPNDGFTVIAPSLPGYGFSDWPDRPITPREIAGYWHKLITDVLGLDRAVAQAGDWGSVVTSWLAFDHPETVAAIHLNMLPLKPHIGAETAPLSDAERDWVAKLKRRMVWAGGYQEIQGTKPQSLAYGLADSPAGLAGWIVEKFQHRLKEPPGSLSLFPMDELITNVMIYWVTNCHNAATWIYHAVRHQGGTELGPGPDGKGERVETPTGFAFFPYDLFPIPPESWPKRAFNVVHRRDFDDGGHFAALEKGDLLVEDMRTFFRAFRNA